MANYVAGIDWSMTCPCLCIYDTKKKLEFNSCEFFFYNNLKKFEKSFGNVHGFLQSEYACSEERFHNLSEWAMKILQKFSVKYVTLEGYAMGGSGAVFNIGENGGLLKHKLWMAGIEFQCPAPSAVKKAFTTKGNAKKLDMHEQLVTSQRVNVSGIMENSNPEKSPVNDVVDAYAMVHYMIKSPDSKYMK